MAQKKKLSVRALERKLFAAEATGRLYQGNAAWYLKLKDKSDAEVQRQVEQNRRLCEDNDRLLRRIDQLETEQERAVVLATKLNEGMTNLRNDIAATVRDAELTRSQLNTVLAHREALLDAMATTRFVAEQKAREE